MQYLLLTRSSRAWRAALADVIRDAEQATGCESACSSDYDDIVNSFRHDVLDEISVSIGIHWSSNRLITGPPIVQSGTASAIKEIEAAIEHLAPEYRDAFVERCRELKSVTEEA